jgi:type IV pilus assembly protein PilE
MISHRISPAHPARHGGFTLIELMVTVAIVGILATIAVETYTSEVRKSRRTDARTALLDLAGREEKLFSVNNAYSQVPSDLGYAAVGVNWPVAVGSAPGDYNITIYSPDTVTQGGAVGTYLITATPINLQANDTQCTQLSVNQTGAQSATPAANTALCWGN